MPTSSAPKLYRLKASVTDKQLHDIGIYTCKRQLREAKFAISAARPGAFSRLPKHTPAVDISGDCPSFVLPLRYIEPVPVKSPSRRKLIAAIRSAKLSAVSSEKLVEAVRLLGLSV